jgi:hypothetical protein
MSKPQNNLSIDELGRLIYEIRGQRVMLDSDLASIYGVETKALNRAVKRNRDRFPEGFRFSINASRVRTFKAPIWHLKNGPRAASQISALRLH